MKQSFATALLRVYVSDRNSAWKGVGVATSASVRPRRVDLKYMWPPRPATGWPASLSSMYLGWWCILCGGESHHGVCAAPGHRRRIHRSLVAARVCACLLPLREIAGLYIGVEQAVSSGSSWFKTREFKYSSRILI